MEILYKITQRPAEGKLFEVKPLEIDRSKFEKPMSDRNREWTRRVIQDAFAQVDKYPEKYASPFYTLIPEKNWYGYKTVVELHEYANDLGGHMADWVEQALEWAQRIFNGESLTSFFDIADTANWYRLIRWKEMGAYRLVGGARYCDNFYPASNVHYYSSLPNFEIASTVPLVVIRK